MMLSLAGMLHVAWFRGGVNGYIKRHGAAKKSRVNEEVLNEPILLAAVKLDPTVISTLPSAFDDSSTPDDSPLLTPYTPSQTPMTLRDAYLFPSISMPNIPNLSTMSIPAIPSLSAMPNIPSLSEITAALPMSLNTEHLNFGFKDAVKSRWGEQRGRFAGMSSSGREMVLNIGGLGLGRRGVAASLGEAVMVKQATTTQDSK